MYMLIEVSDAAKIDIIPHDDATAATVREVCRCATLADVASAVDVERTTDVRLPVWGQDENFDDIDPDDPTPLESDVRKSG